VAASAHHHLVVTKLRGEPTTSAVAAAEGEDRVNEIARMLGGEKPTTRSLAHAREMLDTTAPRQKQA
ncbi:MAG: DNA repair protein RecN, partial [Giesbergeria sp.]